MTWLWLELTTFRYGGEHSTFTLPVGMIKLDDKTIVYGQNYAQICLVKFSNQHGGHPYWKNWNVLGKKYVYLIILENLKFLFFSSTLRCQINVPPPPPAYYFFVFFPTPPDLIWTPPFINFGTQGILLTIKILKIKFTVPILACFLCFVFFFCVWCCHHVKSNCYIIPLIHLECKRKLKMHWIDRVFTI